LAEASDLTVVVERNRLVIGKITSLSVRGKPDTTFGGPTSANPQVVARVSVQLLLCPNQQLSC
jgi:hypothetical protein